jgi:hypothetical protein
MKWRPPGRRKRGRPKLTWTEGIRGLMGETGWWRKTGATDRTGGRLERQTELEEEDNITNKLARGDVNRLYSVLDGKM